MNINYVHVPVVTAALFVHIFHDLLASDQCIWMELIPPLFSLAFNISKSKT